MPEYLPVARFKDNAEAFTCVLLVTSVSPFTVTVADAETPSPAALRPTTEYDVVDEGDTLPPDAEDANDTFVHKYEVAAGVQLAANVEESPRLIAVGDAVSVQTGTAGWFTVTVAVAARPVPATLLP